MKWCGRDDSPTINHEAVEMYLFGYGSLVNRNSFEESLNGARIAPDRGPFAARLDGWAATWNVGSASDRRPNHRWMDEEGQVFHGLLAFWGIEADAKLSCYGAIYRIDPDWLPNLDRREVGYDRLDVTDVVETDRPIAGPVHTYVPRPETVEQLRLADPQQVVVLRSYIDIVRKGFRTLGQEALDELNKRPAPPFRVADLHLEPVVA
jgi:cation transport regulator ChaC